MIQNAWLLAGGALSGLAAMAHLACIAGGAPWYRFFGAGERMARLAERGAVTPALVTLFIASVLTIWSAYGLSGAGMFARLPLLRPILVAICAIYLTRAAALPWMLAYMPDRSPAFLYWSSAIVLILGVIHLIGIISGWQLLARQL